MSASDPSAPGLPLAGGGGAGLPTAAGADEVPVSTGAGTTYTATPLAAAVGDTLAGLYGALDAGDFYVSDGAGVVPASTVAGTVRTAIGAQDGPRVIPLGDYATTVATVDEAVGGAYFAPAGYAITGRTTTLTLEAVGEVVSGVTGTITLRNLTDATDDAALSWTETSATRKSASVALPASAKIYELRFKKSGGAAADYAVLTTANLLVTWS